MYIVEHVFKDIKAAGIFAAEQGYAREITRYLPQWQANFTTCRCGETEIAAFENRENKMLVVGICESCGEEYE